LEARPPWVSGILDARGEAAYRPPAVRAPSWKVRRPPREESPEQEI